jgi:cytochrome c oxidase subunit 2
MQCDRIRRRLVLAVPAAGLLALAAGAETQMEVRMVARKFVFEPATLRVRVGTPVVLHLSAPEVPMGFNLPDFNVRADIVPAARPSCASRPDRAALHLPVRRVLRQRAREHERHAARHRVKAGTNKNAHCKVGVQVRAAKL